MLGDVDFHHGIAGPQVLGHALGNTDVAPLVGGSRRGGILAVLGRVLVVLVRRQLLSVCLHNIDSYESAGADVVADQVEVEKHLVAGKRLVDGDGPSPLGAAPG